MKKRIALVDTDFVDHILSVTTNGEKLLELIFEEFGITPVVHPWVAEHEFVKTKMKKVLDSGLITTIPWKDILKDNKDTRKIYETAICDIYERLNHEELIIDRPITEFRKAGESLGEIQSAITAQMLNIPILCSDDHGSKDIAPMLNSASFTLKVYNAFDVLNKTSQNPETAITYNDCDGILSKCHEKNAKKYKELTKIIKGNYSTHLHK